jgi:elongation factor G
VIVDRLIREFKVQANIGQPQVAYRETITTKAQAEGRFEALGGGKEQYGHVELEVLPGEKGSGKVFESCIEERQIPAHFVEAIQKGVLDSLDSGPIIGYPMLDIRVRLVGGSYDEEKSTEMAFGVAATMACRKAVTLGGPVLMEPVMDLEVVTPEEYLGDVMNDLNKKRAQVNGVESEQNVQVVHAKAPLAELFGFSTDLRSATQGRATFTMIFSEFATIPAKRAETIIHKIKGV